MSTELDTRLKEAIAKRDRLSSDAARIAGRRDAAERALLDIENEIRAKNLDPDLLDQTIAKLESAYAQEVLTLEEAVDKARQELNPFMEPST